MNNLRNILPSEDQLDVRWGTMGARGPGAVVLEISSSYQWSDFGGVIRVFLQDANGANAFGSATLISGQRYVAIPILPDGFYRSISSGSEDNLVTRENRRAPTQTEPTLSEEERIREYAIAANERNPAVLATQRPVRLSEYSLCLAQFDDQGVELFRQGSAAIADKQLHWDLVVIDHESPCFGLLPFDCVYRKLLETRDRICEKLSAFSPECLLLSSWLDAVPLGINIDCSLGGGTIAKVSGDPPRLTISGAEFLCHPWPAEVIVHEVSHIIDHYGGLSENIRCRDRGLAIIRAADARYARLLSNPDNLPRDEWQAALDQIGTDISFGRGLMEDCKYNAEIELVESECRALFYALDRIRTLVNIDAQPEETQNCLFNASASMFTYLATAFYAKHEMHDSDLLRHIKPALKDCFAKIISWLEKPENAAIKQMFKNNILNEEHQWSFWDALNAYHSHCFD